MNPRRIIFHSLAILALAAGAATITNAQAQRTFVSVFGSDANVASNCNNTSPCRSFTAAQTVTNTEGEIIAITSGGYGQVTVTKGITLIGTGVSASLTTPAGGDGITVNIPPADPGKRRVVLRDLRVQGLGLGNNGVQVNDVGTLYIQNCTIERFLGHGINWNTSTQGRLIMSNSISRDNNKNGLRVHANAQTRVTIDDSHFLRNDEDGIAFDSGNIQASISDSVSSDNVGTGVDVDSSASSRVAITRTTASNNGIDGYRVTKGELNIEYCTASGNGDDGMEVEDVLAARGESFSELNASLRRHHAVFQVAGPPTIRVALSLSTNNKDCGFSQQGTGVFERPTAQGSMVRGNSTDVCGTVTTFPAN